MKIKNNTYIYTDLLEIQGVLDNYNIVFPEVIDLNKSSDLVLICNSDEAQVFNIFTFYYVTNHIARQEIPYSLAHVLSYQKGSWKMLESEFN